MFQNELVSIIFVHYGVNQDRSILGRKCLEKLIATTKNYPAEIIVVDNGGSLEDSKFFLGKVENREIAHYIRNADNLWFGYARNQGIAIAIGKYICITDNDIDFEDGWLEECMNIYKKVEGKYFITPLYVDRQHRWSKFRREPVVVDGKKYETNTFAGSSCWIMKKEHFKDIGWFVDKMNSGTDYGRRQSKLGYSVILLPEQKAENFGRRGTPYEGYKKIIRKNGEKFSPHIEIKKKLTNNRYLILNEKTQRFN